MHIHSRWPGGHKLRHPGSDDDEEEESASPPPPPEKPKKSTAKAKESAKPKKAAQPKQSKGRTRKPMSEGGRSVTTEFYNHATYEDMPVTGHQSE